MAFIQLNRPMIFGGKHRDAGDVVETSKEVAAHMIGIGAASNAQLNETAAKPEPKAPVEPEPEAPVEPEPEAPVEPEPEAPVEPEPEEKRGALTWL